MLVGSRAQVWHGTAYKFIMETSFDLWPSQLVAQRNPVVFGAREGPKKVSKRQGVQLNINYLHL